MNYEDPEKRLAFLQKEVLDPNSEIYLENLLDLAVSITYDIHSSGTWKNSKPIKKFLERYSNFSEKVYKNRLSLNDFQCIKTIGQGGFGRVDLVKHKETKSIYAMKVIEKNTYIQNGFDGFWPERDILAKNVSDWLVKCFYMFMDLKKLYIVMEYMPGGNLFRWLDTLEEFNDEQTHFYAMEMLLAVETLHNMEFLHRDLKPDNMLLDKNGHLKLADFGTCIKVENGKVKTNFQVGTPDYIAPEVISKAGVNDLEVGFEIDWWAFGIVLYELFFGETPFEGESTVTLYKNIMLYKTTLCYPNDKTAPDNYIDFLKGLLTESSERMDINKIKRHPYMIKSPHKWNFENIQQHHTPLIFEVSDEADTQYVLYDPNDKRNNITGSFANNNFFSGENLAFTGFTFNRSHLYGSADSTIKSNSSDNSKLLELQGKMSDIELSKKKLTVKLDESLSELSQIQTKLSNAEKELTEKEQIISVKTSEQNQISEGNKLLKTKLDSLTKEYDGTKREIDQLKSWINEKDVSIKTMKGELSNVSENNCNLKKTLEQLEQKLANVNFDLNEKSGQLERLSKIENILEDERNLSKDLTADINTKTRKLKEYEKQLELLNERINEFNSQSNKISIANISNNEQTKELNALKEKYDKLQREKQVLESNLNLLTVDLKEIKDDRDLIRSELRTETLKKTALEKTRDKLNKDLTEKTGRFNILQNKVYETEDQMKIMKQALNINESEKEQLMSECKMYSSMAVVKRLEIEEAKTELDEVKEQHERIVTEFENERKKLNDRLLTVTDELDQLRKLCDKQKSKLSALEAVTAENNGLTNEIYNLQLELQSRKEEVDELLDTKRRLEIDLKKSNEQTVSNKMKVEALVEKINTMVNNPQDIIVYRKKKEVVGKESNKRVKELESELNKCKSNISNNQLEINELKNECQSGREKVQALEQEMETKNSVISHLKSKLGDGSSMDLSVEEDLDKHTTLTSSLQGKIEVMKKGKGRQKITWSPFFAVLQPYQITLFQNENDPSPLQIINLRDVIHIKETTQADCVHVDKALLPQMIQIIYSKPETEENRRISVMPMESNRRTKGSTLTLDESSASTRNSTTSLSGIINIENHSFIHIRCRSSQVCDFCHQSCSDMFNPPAVLECSKCKQRIHYEHIHDKKFPACQEALENMSIKLESREARMAWFTRFKRLKQYQNSEETRLAPNTFYRSFNLPFNRLSPNNNNNTTTGGGAQ